MGARIRREGGVRVRGGVARGGGGARRPGPAEAGRGGAGRRRKPAAGGGPAAGRARRGGGRGGPPRGRAERGFAFGTIRQLFEGVVADTPARREQLLAGAAAPAAAVLSAHPTVAARATVGPAALHARSTGWRPACRSSAAPDRGGRPATGPTIRPALAELPGGADRRPADRALPRGAPAGRAWRARRVRHSRRACRLYHGPPAAQSRLGGHGGARDDRGRR